MSTSLSTENLYELSDGEVKTTVLSTFTRQLKASSSVRDTFFHGVSMPIEPVNAGFVDDVATALTCSSIGRSSLYGFSDTVDHKKSDDYWSSKLTSAHALTEGRHLYSWAFPQHCQADGHTFAEYLAQDPVAWGSRLKSAVVSSSFVNTTMVRLIGAEADWLAKLNLVFYKINRLDPSLTAEVLDAWKTAYPDKGIVNTWESHAFIPPQQFSNDQFLSQVNAVIAQKHTWTDTLPGNAYEETVWEDYGLKVVAFLKGKPKQLGLTTGKKPDNFDYYNKATCFVAGTPILLADRSIRPIEQIAGGHQVLAQDGQISIQTDEQIVVTLERAAYIYGINEVEPFFDRAHAFWTEDGWKSITPEITREANPSFPVSQLSAGDTLYRVAEGTSFSYQKVRIEKITRRPIPAGSQLYGLHLIGARSYHAHGFCVAMNYPMITEKRLTGGLARLTDAERTLLAQALAPIMPMLKRAIGSFIEAPVHRALGGEDARELLAPPVLDLATLNRTYEIHTESEEAGTVEANELIFESGRLFLGNERILEPEIRGNDLTWHQAKQGRYFAGLLRFAPGGLALYGQVFIGSSVQDATVSQIVGTVPPSVYSTEVATHPTSEMNEYGYESGVTMTLGYRYKSPNALQLILDFDGQSALPIATPIPNPTNKQQLEILVNYDAELTPVAYATVSKLWPASGRIQFSWDGSTFSGTMTRYDPTRETPTQAHYAWIGKVKR